MRAGEELDFPPGYGLDSMGDMTDMMIEFDRLPEIERDLKQHYSTIAIAIALPVNLKGDRTARFHSADGISSRSFNLFYYCFKN